MTIGRKIALVVYLNLALLIGLGLFSFWAFRITGRLTEDSINRLVATRLTETIAGAQANVKISLGKMLLLKTYSPEIEAEMQRATKQRDAALAQFKAAADTPKGAAFAHDMIRIAEARTVSTDSVVASLRAGRLPDASQEFLAPTGGSLLRTKASEASAWEQSQVDANEQERKDTVRLIWILMIGGGLFAVPLASLGAVFLTRDVAPPLAAVASHLEAVARGDLGLDAPENVLIRRDEIGGLARALQKMTTSLRAMVREIGGGVQVLSSSSTELMASCGDISSGTFQASERAHAVALAAEQLSHNMGSVASGMEQATNNLTHVAAATEEMTATIAEIARISETARQMTDAASDQANRVTRTMNGLDAAAREIGKVTEAIAAISAQTHLLALNAGIEAARAGDAGRGFAIVANEIKSLAQQTALATQDIKARIGGVQVAAAGTIVSIEGITNSIHEVTSVVTSIAAAVEEQTAATREIARNISEASNGVALVNRRVSETSQTSTDIAQDIIAVDQVAGDIATGSDYIRSSAISLSKIAETLNLSMARFRA